MDPQIRDATRVSIGIPTIDGVQPEDEELAFILSWQVDAPSVVAETITDEHFITIERLLQRLLEGITADFRSTDDKLPADESITLP